MEAAELSALLQLARDAATAVQPIIEQHYQQQPETRFKSDQSPVTVADEACEQRIRDIISTAHPEHAFWGEEGGMHSSDSEFLWLVDPIDGTKSFVRGYGFFSTQVALMHRGELVLGVSHAPVFGQTAWAARGQGAFLNGEAIRVDTHIDPSMRCVSTGNIRSLIDKKWNKLGDLLKKFSKIRGYGDFYHYHLLAAGKLDLVIESDVNILDVAALSVIVQEAGGVVTSLQGDALDLSSTDIVAGTPETHELALRILHG